MKILIIVNRAEFLLSHRYEMCLALLGNGAEVHIACPSNQEVVKRFISDGFIHHPLEFFGDSLSPFRMLTTSVFAYKIIKRLRPDVVHTIAMKPVLLGGLVSKVAGVPALVSSISGLGLVFSSSKFKHRLIRRLVSPILTFCFKHKNHAVVLQNDNDCSTLVDSGVLDYRNVAMIRGSGVDLKTFTYTPEPKGVPVVLFAARLLKDKGLSDLVEAVKILRLKGVELRLLVAGLPDDLNNNTLSEADLKEWSHAGLIERLGFRSDMEHLLSVCNIFCFPSYYGEGVPKVILEAAASGRPVITTDHPGCRDAVNCDSGLLVPIRSPNDLSEAIQQLLENSELRVKMGRNARTLAEQNFSVDTVVDKHMKIYESLIR